MDEFTACECAYKQGYEKGRRDAVKRGRWVMKEALIRSPFAKNAYCSECLEETGYAHNYCPNCGADMRGENDEDL